MIAKYLWEAGSLIFVILGSMHMYSLFFTRKFLSTNEYMMEEMKISSPNISKETTMWKAWIGFNASHSSGAIFIGVINFYLAARYFTILQTDHFFFPFNILTIGFYLWLGKKYWFKVPFTGILITLICFIMSYIVAMLL